MSVYVATPANQSAVNQALGAEMVTQPLYAGSGLAYYVAEWASPPAGTDAKVTNAGGQVFASVTEACSVLGVAPSQSQANLSSLRTKADQVIATLENATSTKATWDAFSAAQRQEFTRIGLLAVAKIARLVLGRLDAS